MPAERASIRYILTHRHTRARSRYTRTRIWPRARVRPLGISCSVRGPLIILLNRPRSYCNACAFARACACVCVRALNGTINLLCRRGDCRGRRKLFGAIECELRYCAPESNPARSIRPDALFSFCACIAPRRSIDLRDVAKEDTVGLLIPFKTSTSGCPTETPTDNGVLIFI